MKIDRRMFVWCDMPKKKWPSKKFTSYTSQGVRSLNSNRMLYIKLNFQEDRILTVSAFLKMKRSESPNGEVVYFIQMSDEHGPIKIGLSSLSSLRSRLDSLQVGNPYPLILLGAIPGDERTEARLHKKFSKYRLMGEWFHLSESLQKFIWHHVITIEDMSDTGDGENENRSV